MHLPKSVTYCLKTLKDNDLMRTSAYSGSRYVRLGEFRGKDDSLRGLQLVSYQ